MNSPPVTSVAKRLGLTHLPSVRMITERLQCTHPSSAQNGAISTLRKPVFVSNSEVARELECTPVPRPHQPMGREGEDDQVAAQPMGAKEMGKPAKPVRRLESEI